MASNLFDQLLSLLTYLVDSFLAAIPLNYGQFFLVSMAAGFLLMSVATNEQFESRTELFQPFGKR